MIYSMTAFAHKACEGAWGTLTWELRSVNHRYLELGVHLPEGFTVLETEIRKQAKHLIRRGKVDCSLKYHPGILCEVELKVNRPLVTALLKAGQEISQISEDQVPPMGMREILVWPGVLIAGQSCLKEACFFALKLFNETLEELVQEREREGNAIREGLLLRLAEVIAQLTLIQNRIPKVLQLQEDRLRCRFTTLKSEIDSTRLEQELCLLAQRMDLTEEVERMQTHTDEVVRSLEEGGSLGRRLDFLLQELNREANTIASKSVDKKISQGAVILKVLIEQMREQVQNLE